MECSEKTLQEARMVAPDGIVVSGANACGRMVPSPLFVDSASSSASQAADVCICSINRGFRVPKRGFLGMPGGGRQKFGANLKKLMFKGSGYRDRENIHPSDGTFPLPDS